MTEDQIKHYLAGGLFTAIYNPKIIDLRIDDLERRGEEAFLWPNSVATPIIQPSQYEGQHRFNSSLLVGWSPEEDFDNLEIISGQYNDYSQCVLPQHFYRLTYLNRKKIGDRFANGDMDSPLVMERTYISKCDEATVRLLGEVMADKVEYTLWNGEPYEEIKWIEIQL